MANKIYMLILISSILISCTVNETISINPNFVASTPFTSTGDKQIVRISANELQITSSVISSKEQANIDDLARFRAIVSAIDYAWQTSIDPEFVTIYSDKVDAIKVRHFRNLKEKINNGLPDKIENIETNITSLDERSIQISTYKISFQPTQKFTDEVDLYIDLNQTEYSVDDTLKVFLQTNKPCYLKILNFTPSGEINFLNPNAEETLYKPGEIHIFSQKINELRNQTTSGKSLVKILASTSPINLDFPIEYKPALIVILDGLGSLPNTDLTEVDIEYILDYGEDN